MPASPILAPLDDRRALRDAAVILGVAMLAALIGLRGLWGEFSLTPDAPGWWSVVIAVPAACGVALKARSTVAAVAVTGVCVVVDLLTVGGVGTIVALFDALYAAVLVGSPRARRWIAVGIGCAVGALFVVGVTIGDLRFGVLLALQFGALLGMNYWWAISVAQARELADSHRREKEQAALLAERDRDAALLAEREAMARELHDLVAGHVSAGAIRAEAALVADAGPSADRAALQAVRSAALDAHGALRSMIQVLRGADAVAAPPGLDGLASLVDDARSDGLEIVVSGDVPALPVALDRCLARVAREALVNAARHAPGARVAVAFTDDDGMAGLRVTSSGGTRAPALTGTGWGLELLRERVTALGGTFRAGAVGDGWDVVALLPRESA